MNERHVFPERTRVRARYFGEDRRQRQEIEKKRKSQRWRSRAGREMEEAVFGMCRPYLIPWGFWDVTKELEPLETLQSFWGIHLCGSQFASVHAQEKQRREVRWGDNLFTQNNYLYFFDFKVKIYSAAFYKVVGRWNYNYPLVIVFHHQPLMLQFTSISVKNGITSLCYPISYVCKFVINMFCEVTVTFHQPNQFICTKWTFVQTLKEFHDVVPSIFIRMG